MKTMTDTDTAQRPDPAGEPTGPSDLPRARRPYQAPKLSKKRSLARATLFTATGPTMAGITMIG